MLPVPKHNLGTTFPLARRAIDSQSDAPNNPLSRVSRSSFHMLEGEDGSNIHPISRHADNNKPRTLPSLRSLNILPSPPSALTRGLVHARDFEDDDLVQDEQGSPAQTTRKRSRADTSISRASHRSTSRIDSILDFSHDGPRPSSSTSACSSVASLTSSSSYTSHNTVSSENHHHGQLHHPGDRRVMTHPQPPYITTNRLQQSRHSSASSLKDSYHPFGYYNAACGLPQQLLPLNLDSQTVRHVSASHGSITSVATPVSAHRLFSKQDPLECAEDRPSSSSFSCSHYPQAPHSIAILDRALTQPNHHPRPRQSPEIEAAKILAAVAESVCSKTDASLARRLSPFHPVHKRESKSDVPGDQRERQYCQEEHMTRNYSRLRPSRSAPSQTSAMHHPYYPFHRIEDQDRRAPSTSTASDTIEAPEHQPYELYMAPLRNITDRARQEELVRPEMRDANRSFDSQCVPEFRRVTFSETQDDRDVASGWRFDARKKSDGQPRGTDPGRPYVCSGCNRSFARRYDRNRHARKHTGERPYICANPDCQDDFVRPDALQRHYKANEVCADFKYKLRFSDSSDGQRS